MNKKERSILLEAARRQELQKDPSARRVVLILPTEAKSMKSKGLIASTSSELPRVLNWYSLTDAGLAKVNTIRDEIGLVFGEKGNTEKLWMDPSHFQFPI